MQPADAAATETLLARLRDAGDLRGAAGEAIRRFGPEILSYLRALLRDADAAQEVFSAFSERVWKGMDQLRGELSFRAWAYRVAHNAAQDFHRDAYRRRGRAFLDGEVSQLVEEICSRTPFFMKTEARTRLHQMKERLDEGERTLLVLRIENQLPFEQVAEVLSHGGEPLTAAAVKKRFERLKLKLRALAEELELLPGDQ